MNAARFVRTVPTNDLITILNEMELTSLDVATSKCPHCGAIHVAPGLTKLIAYVYGNCGKSVEEPKGID